MKVKTIAVRSTNKISKKIRIMRYMASMLNILREEGQS
ncbi:hypothetical protein MmTuc01_1658 [Methanosarcina mazei Tuc01]|uniref:Uncharacterized protein n=1 Tax=Methanosarcina mazei Tuc01 TaxID=1236903 RepID=M1QA00_METMZ|nr:hypothetical protein MmTuc01_1658 [Methanosarcina mazei Tuc01]